MEETERLPDGLVPLIGAATSGSAPEAIREVRLLLTTPSRATHLYTASPSILLKDVDTINLPGDDWQRGRMPGGDAGEHSSAAERARRVWSEEVEPYVRASQAAALALEGMIKEMPGGGASGKCG